MECRTLKVTTKNWQKCIARALRQFQALEITVERVLPWRCTCGRLLANVRISDGMPVCCDCAPDARSEVVRGSGTDLRRGGVRAVASSSGNPLGVVAVVAGQILVSPLARRQFRLGECLVDEFVHDFGHAISESLGLRIDPNAIWRRADGSRIDGYDVADLVFGFRGGTYSDEQIDGFPENMDR